jgi:hypothetical protein
VYLKGNPFVTNNEKISTTKNGKLDVYNLAGSKILSKNLEAGENVILASGLYFIQLTTIEGIFRQKIVL